MHLYLVRHATPAATTGDPDLGETGREEAARLAALFGRLGLPAGGTAVLASSARRARQTAGPIAAAVGLAAGAIQAFPPPAGPVPTSPGDLALALARLAPASEHVVLVGHWGTVNTLYGWLVGVPAAAFPQAYAAAAAVACEAPFAEKGGQVRWLVSPAVLPGAGATTGGVTRLGAVEFGGGVRNPTDVSAIDAADDWLVIGADETNLVQLLKRRGDRYEVVRDVVLDAAAEEIDVEGITHDGSTFYVLGSHSAKRKKIDPEKTYEKNRAALEKVTAEPDRAFLGRFGLGADGKPTAVEATKLRKFLKAHPVLGLFAGVPGKENGIDLEGVAAVGDRLYIGCRGPVLRGNWTPVVRCRFGEPVADPEVLYLPLGGRGVRDLARVRDGFLVLAGPVGDGPGSFQVYHWDGLDCLPGTRETGRPGRVNLLGEVSPDGGPKAEALAVLAETDAGYEVLVVFDGEPNGGPTRYRVTRPD